MITTARRRRTLALVASASALMIGLVGCARGQASPEGDVETVASPGITDTELVFGINTPLTGHAAGPGNCTVDGATAYFGVKNAEGGITFGDGKTRTITIRAYDDAYEPDQAKANFQQMVNDEVFAAGIGLGTGTNQAWRDDAISAGVPQVLVMTGDPTFSVLEDGVMSIGLVPTYQQEGQAFAEALIADGKPHKVAIIRQNDDYGLGYVEGFVNAVEGNANIEIVKELTYAPSDASTEAQITELHATGADVLVHIVSQQGLATGGLAKVLALGWKPIIFLPSNTASPGVYLIPNGYTAEDTVAGVYAVGFAEAAAAPPFAATEEGAAYFEAIAEYAQGVLPSGGAQDGKTFPHCLWSWQAAQILEQAFTKMTEPTRESFYEALRSIKGFTPQFAFGPVDLSRDGLPAIADVVVQKFTGVGYRNVDVVE
jgi:branched-chain amino acid transport system substrate-binding protein